MTGPTLIPASMIDPQFVGLASGAADAAAVSEANASASEANAADSRTAAEIAADQAAASAASIADPLAGVNLDGGVVGVTPDIVYQFLTIDGGAP